MRETESLSSMHSPTFASWAYVPLRVSSALLLTPNGAAARLRRWPLQRSKRGRHSRTKDWAGTVWFRRPCRPGRRPYRARAPPAPPARAADPARPGLCTCQRTHRVLAPGLRGEATRARAFLVPPTASPNHADPRRAGPAPVDGLAGGAARRAPPPARPPQRGREPQALCTWPPGLRGRDGCRRRLYAPGAESGPGPEP